MCELTQENTHTNSFYIFRQQGSLLNFKEMLHNLFYILQNSFSVANLSLSVPIIAMCLP